MGPSSSLFILIKSLSKSEKRYFKRFCTIYSKEKQNNYLLLFNAIVEQKEYDEQQIKSQFRNEKFVKQLNVLKVYLYRLIIKSLRQFYTSSDKDMILKDLVTHSLILLKKGLYDESYRMINSAKETARFEKNHFALAEILSLEKKLVGQMNIRSKEELLRKITFEEDVILTEILLFQKYTKIMNVLDADLISCMFTSGDKMYSEKYEHISYIPLLEKEPDTCSEETLHLFYNCRFMLNILQKSKEDILSDFEKIICILKKSGFLLNRTGNDSWGCLFHIIIYFLREGEINEAENKLNEIKEALLPSTNRISDSHLCGPEIYADIFELILIVSIADVNRSSLLVEKIKKYFADKPGTCTDKMHCTAYYFIALYYFMIRKNRLSLDYLKKFAEEYDLSRNSEIEFKLKILYVLNNYELGELDHLEYYLINNLRSLNRYEASKEDYSDFFRTFLKIIRSKTNAEADELLKFLKQRFMFRSGHSESVFLLQYFNIGIWNASKIYN